jgi:hypothetical protein
VFAFLARFHHMGLPQLLQVRAGQLEGNLRFGRQPFHRFLALAQQIDQLQPLGTAHGLADAGDLGIQQVFYLSSGIFHHILQRTFEC